MDEWRWSRSVEQPRVSCKLEGSDTRAVTARPRAWGAVCCEPRAAIGTSTKEKMAQRGTTRKRTKMTTNVTAKLAAAGARVWRALMR